jgi:hypothetical protein
MKINEILAEARSVKLKGTTPSSRSNSALGSFLRGAGMAQGADAVDAYANANAFAPGVRQTKKIGNLDAQRKLDAKTAAAEAKRARFIAVIKQQADRQGSISMTDIGKRIPKQGEYADPTRRREAINNVAQELKQQGVTVTASNTPTTAPQTTPTTDEPYSIGGQQLDPTKPGDKAIIDKLKTAQATKPKTAPATNPNQPAAGKFDWDEEVHTTDANTPAPSGWVKLKIPPSIQPGKESPYRLVHQKYAQDWIANGWVLAK